MPIVFNKRENLEPPLGISYMGAMLAQAGHKVFLKDYEIEHFSKENIASFVANNKIGLVGISFRTASYKSAKIFVEALEQVRNDVLIVAGGHHASAFPEHTISNMPCDVVVKGEGEYAINELAEAVECQRSLEGIKGITYRSGGQIIDNEQRPPIIDLDELPFPERQKLPYEHYNVATILTSRGCPFSCIYCDKGISTRQVKFRTPENIYRELSQVNKAYPDKRIYFVDDHFFLAKERLNKIFDLIEKNKIKFSWVCQARADGVDAEILKRAKEIGCELIMYGIESGDPSELEYMRKQATTQQARTAIMLTNEAGIRVRTNFMLGFPISTHKTVRNTIKFAGSVPADVVRFFSVAPLPNTELWDRVYGRDIDLNKIRWDEFDFYTPTFPIPGLSCKDISAYVGAAYIHVLKKKVLRELTLTFLPRFIKLLYLGCKTRRLRGNVSIVYPSTVNLLLDLNSATHSRGLWGKIRFFIDALKLEKKLK